MISEVGIIVLFVAIMFYCAQIESDELRKNGEKPRYYRGAKLDEKQRDEL